MTTAQVHLLMAGLGLLAILLLAGVFREPRLHNQRKPWLSILAGVAIAASPLSRFWRNTFSGSDLLTQSLLVSAICLLALLLVSLLLIPLRVFRRKRIKNVNTNTKTRSQISEAEMFAPDRGGLSPIMINADAPSNDPINSADTQAVTQPYNQAEPLFDAATYNDPLRSSDIKESSSVTVDKQRPDYAANEANRLKSEEQAAEKLEADRVATEKLVAEKIEAERLADEKLKLMAEQLEAEHLAADKLKAEQLEAERLAEETLKAEQLEAERLAEETLKAEQLEANRLAAQRLKTEQLEANRLAAEKLQAEQLADKKALEEKLRIERAQSRANANKNDQISTGRLDESISSSIAANDKISTNQTEGVDPFISPASHSLSDEDDLASTTMRIEEDNLDLSETEQLFAEIRSQQTEVELPDDKELKDATQRMAMDELDFDSNLIEQNELRGTLASSKTDYDQIEEAEVVDADDSNLEFGNDMTGEYAHPGGQTSQSSAYINNTSAQVLPLPETLGDAMLAAKMTAVSVQSHVSNLEDSISEVEELQTQQAMTSTTTLKEHQAVLAQKNALLNSEDKARRAAESVIAAQTAVIDRTTAQKNQTHVLLEQERQQLVQERQRLQQMQHEVERSRKMARSAAQLARKAAIAQQEIRSVAMREQSARLKSQESTRKAVTIARNAISALAAEERKQGHTRH